MKRPRIKQEGHRLDTWSYQGFGDGDYRPGSLWGPWLLNPTQYSLEIWNGNIQRYYVDMDRCLSSAQVLDWIMQIQMKGWATDEVTAGLVRAINDLVHPQGMLCSMGVERGPLAMEVMRGRIDNWFDQAEKEYAQ